MLNKYVLTIRMNDYSRKQSSANPTVLWVRSRDGGNPERRDSLEGAEAAPELGRL